MISQEEVSKVLRIGDVLNFDSKAEWWNLLMKLVYSEIRRAQKKKFRPSQKYRDVHSELVVDFKQDGTPLVLSVTIPNAVIEPLFISPRTKVVTLCRLKGLDMGISPQWIADMRAAVMELLGTGYDLGQMLAIKFKLQGWPKWFANLFDMGSRRTVCSGGVQYCLLTAWEKMKKRIPPPLFISSQPLHGNPPNDTYPAHFVNHPTFNIIQEWRA